MERRWRGLGKDGSAWIAIAAALALAALLFIPFRSTFDHDRDLADMPSLSLAFGLMAAGAVFLCVIPLIERAEHLRGRALRRLLSFILLVGLGLRIAMFWTTPAHEDDFYRYLWDGAVLVNGYDPFAFAPNAAADTGHAPKAIKDLAEAAGDVHARINYPELHTIYPPVAQAAFALAYLAEPWSLLSWRLICLGGELATAALLLALLQALGRSPLWVALYWWNPLVIKELINSAHMEAILMPLVLAAVLLSLRQRPLAATAALTVAIGAKIWPIILAPLIWRRLVANPLQLAAAMAILGVGCLIWALLSLQATLGESSGLVAYVTVWKTNSAITPLLERIIEAVVVRAGGEQVLANRIVRALLGLTLAAIILMLLRKPISDDQDLIRRMLLATASLYLLSPAQFPWYLTWLLPFLVLLPVRGWLIATPLVALYYSLFYFRAIDSYWVYRDIVVWLIWIPIWGVLAYDRWNRTTLPVRVP